MEPKSIAPIVLFAYNRAAHTSRTIDYLLKNKEAADSILYVYCDGWKQGSTDEGIRRVKDVRKIIDEVTGFRSVNIIQRKENYGLAKNIMAGVSEVLSDHGSAIIIEDDISVSPTFLEYMNKGLSLYENTEEVMCICSFLPFESDELEEAFFLRYMSCWGWATWESAWDGCIDDSSLLLSRIESGDEKYDFTIGGSYVNLLEQLEANAQGILNTWAVKWYASIFLSGGLCLYPNKTLVQNNGLDGSGTNSGRSKRFGMLFDPTHRVSSFPIIAKESHAAFRLFQQHFKKTFRFRKLKIMIYPIYKWLKEKSRINIFL